MKQFKKSWKLLHVNGLFVVLNSAGKLQYRFGNLDKDIPEEAVKRAKHLANKYNLQY